MNLLKMRPHHIHCLPYLNIPVADRGEKFCNVLSEFEKALTSQPEVRIQAAEGVDGLCQECYLRVGDGCQSSEGDEEQVRKWDAIILKELGVSLGTVMTSEEWHKLIADKGRLNLCQRCKWREYCSMAGQK